MTLSLFDSANAGPRPGVEVVALSTGEREQFAVLENTIERGLKTFMDVGTALMVVRDSKLYRQDYATFEEYCRVRWNMGKSRVYQMIDAAMVVDNLQKSKILDSVPNESQARTLAALRPEEQPQVWKRAVDTAPNGKVTAAHVQRVVDEYEEQAEELAAGEAGYDWMEEEEAVGTPLPRAMAVHYSSKTDLWATPQALFDALDAEFHFALDVCATADNAKCARYFTQEDDGLVQEWQGTCWMNPPYGDEIIRWVAKAHTAAQEGATVVCLVPARTDTGWWWDYCIHGEVRFLRGRLKFGDGKGSAPFPSALVVFRPFVEPVDSRVIWWDYHV